MRAALTARIGALLAVAALFAGPALSQTHLPADPVFCNPSSNPLDAVTAAPDFHHVLFEDEHVRVLEIIIPAASVEPVHIHALPSVITGETGGGGGAKFLYIQFEMKNGKFTGEFDGIVGDAGHYRFEDELTDNDTLTATLFGRGKDGGWVKLHSLTFKRIKS